MLNSFDQIERMILVRDYLKLKPRGTTVQNYVV